MIHYVSVIIRLLIPTMSFNSALENPLSDGFQELRLELQLAKLRNEEIRKQNDELNHIANTLEKNETRVRGFKQQILQSRFS